MRILVVEDDEEVSTLLKISLEAESFSVDCTDNGETGSFMARTNEYDLVTGFRSPSAKLIKGVQDTPQILSRLKSSHGQKVGILNSELLCQ